MEKVDFLAEKRRNVAIRLIAAAEKEEDRFTQLKELGVDLSDYYTPGAEVTAVVALLFSKSMLDFEIFDRVISDYLHHGKRKFLVDYEETIDVTSPEDLVDFITDLENDA